MKKTLATALLIGALSFSSAPAFATSPSPEPVLKGFTSGPVTPTDHAEPGLLPYPAPVVTPNTVNGVVPAELQPTPAPTSTAPATGSETGTKAPTELASTGTNDSLYIWGAVGLLALIAGITSVIHARRKA